MNYFYDLPEVLQEKILTIRNNDYMAEKIQKLYYKYQSRYTKINALVSLTKQLYYYDVPFDGCMLTIEVSTERSAKIIEFIQKKIKKKDISVCSNCKIWNNLLIDLHYAIYAKMSGEAYGSFYIRVDKVFHKILNILDIKWMAGNHVEYFRHYGALHY